MSLFRLAYKVGAAHLHTRDGHKLSAKAFTRYHLDRMGIGREVTELVWSSRRIKLPPSTLTTRRGLDASQASKVLDPIRRFVDLGARYVAIQDIPSQVLSGKPERKGKSQHNTPEGN